MTLFDTPGPAPQHEVNTVRSCRDDPQPRAVNRWVLRAAATYQILHRFLRLLLGLPLWWMTFAAYAEVSDCHQPWPTSSQTSKMLPVRHEGAKYFIGLTPQQFGVPMMWSTRTESATLGAGFNGLPVGDRLVQFELVGEQAELRMLSTLRKGDAQTQDAARLADTPRLLAKLDLDARDGSDLVWVNVNPLVLGFGPESDGERWWEYFLGLLSSPNLSENLSRMIDARQRPGAAQFRAELSFSYSSRLPSSPGISEKPSEDGGARSQISMVVLHSFMLLPSQPMPTRKSDPRVGFLSVSKQSFAGDFRGSQSLSYIARFRLEPRCAEKKPVVPRQRIVFYMAPEVPETWRAAIRAGIMDWSQALEFAGFADAIEVSEVPPEPDWNPADPRFNTVRWVAQPVSNAIGKPTIDPRTGEILSSSLIIWSGVLNHFADQYKVSVADTDPRNLKGEDPKLLQEILRYVVTHETGHALGLSHNHKAASAYPMAWLRDAEMTSRYGTSASIMSYGRFNYVARKEDQVLSFIPKIGPYDYFAIRWGYSPDLPDANDLLEFMPLAMHTQMQQRLLEFSGDEAAADLDPQHLREGIGDNRVLATAEGLIKLRWTWRRVALTSVDTPEGLANLRRQYHAALDQRSYLLRGLVKVIGGLVETRRSALSHGALYKPVDVQEQHAALKLLLETLADDDAHVEIALAGARFQPGGFHVALVSSYKLVFSDLVQPLRLARLREQSAESLDVSALLSQLQTTLFAAGKRWPMNPVRLELQSMYLTRLRSLLSEAQIVPIVRSSVLSGEVPSHALDLTVEARRTASELIILCRRVARQHPQAEIRKHYGALAAAITATVNMVFR